MRRLLLLLMAATLLIAIVPVVGCSEEAEQEAEAEPYVIGAIFSTTGDGSNLGVPEKQTVEMLVDQINEAGGINGRELQVIIYDDESKSDKSATLANKLIEQDNVRPLSGPQPAAAPWPSWRPSPPLRSRWSPALQV